MEKAYPYDEVIEVMEEAAKILGLEEKDYIAIK